MKIFNAESLAIVLEEDFLWCECVSILLGADRSKSNDRLRERFGDEATSYISARREIVTISDTAIRHYRAGKRILPDPFENSLDEVYVLNLYELRRYIVFKYLVPHNITVPSQELMKWLKIATTNHIHKTYQEQVSLANEVLAELLDERPEYREFFEKKYSLGPIQYTSPD